MSTITVNVTSNIRQVLAGMSKLSSDVADKAVARALNRTIDMVRTQTSRVMRSEGYNFKAAEIKSSISVVKASNGQRSVMMRVPRHAKSMMEFSPTESSKGVTVKIKGARKLIAGAFIGQLQNGRYGVYVEDKSAGKQILRRRKQYKRGGKGGWQAYPVRKLYGPSLGGAFVNRALQADLDKFAATTLEARLRHEVDRLA